MSQKKVERTKAVKLAAEQALLAEITQNNIEAYKFLQLLRSGEIREECGARE